MNSSAVTIANILPTAGQQGGVLSPCATEPVKLPAVASLKGTQFRDKSFPLEVYIDNNGPFHQFYDVMEERDVPGVEVLTYTFWGPDLLLNIQDSTPYFVHLAHIHELLRRRILNTEETLSRDETNMFLVRDYSGVPRPVFCHKYFHTWRLGSVWDDKLAPYFHVSHHFRFIMAVPAAPNE